MHSSNVSWSCFAALICTMAGCSPSEEPQAESEEQASAVATQHLPSAWVPPDPPWLQKLEEPARRELNKANEWLEGAYWQWDQGNLPEAKQGLQRACEVYSTRLGEDHWKTSDCRFDLALLDVELTWRKELDNLEVSHLSLDFTDFVEYEYREPTKPRARNERQQRNPADQQQHVEKVCCFVKEKIDESYKEVLKYYRLRSVGRAKYEQWKQQGNMSLLEHAYNYLKDAATESDVFPEGHFLRADVYYDLGRMLTSKSEAIGSAEATEEATNSLATALNALRTGIPPDDSVPKDRWIRTLELAEGLARNLGRHAEARMAMNAHFAMVRTITGETTAWHVGYLVASATLHNQTHDNAQALGLLNEAFDLLNNLSDADRKAMAEEDASARLHEERAIAYTGLRQYKEACDDYKLALEAYSCIGPNEHDECWRTHYFYAAALSRRALELLSEPERAEQEEVNPTELFEQADRQFELACTANKVATYHALFRVMQLRARMARALDQDQGRAEIPCILKELKELVPTQDVSKARWCRLIAYGHAWLEENEEAKQWCDKATQWYEKAREGGGLEPIKVALWHENESPYLLAAIIEKRLGHDPEALTWLEQHAAQGLHEMLSPKSGQPPQPGSLWAQLAELDSIRRAGKATIEANPRPAEPRMDQTEPDVSTSCDVDEHTAVVVWLDDVPPGHMRSLPNSWVFVITKNEEGISSRWFPLNSDLRGRTLPQEIRETVRQRPKERGAKEWLQVAGDLFEQRLEPVWEHLKDVEQIYVLNRGLMLGVPVEMLPIPEETSTDKETFVVDRHAVAYIPSCSTLAQLRSRRSQEHDPTRLLAVYAPHLKCAKCEALSVGEYSANAQTVPFKADRDTERKLGDMNRSRELAEYTFVFFSTHARSDPFDLGDCFLELEQGLWPNAAATRDGRLDFWEISGLDLSARLVVLSGCETGLGRPLETEGYLGLPHAFFNAGVRGAVVSLWRIPDSPSTAYLMDRFFHHLVKNGLPEGKALGAAKRDLRSVSRKALGVWCLKNNAQGCCKYIAEGDPKDQPYTDPYYWAGFVLVGPHD